MQEYIQDSTTYVRHYGRQDLFITFTCNPNWERDKNFTIPRTTGHGRVFNTYQDACRELQLLEDDNHWDLTLADAAVTSTPSVVCNNFDDMLSLASTNFVGKIYKLYDKRHLAPN